MAIGIEEKSKQILNFLKKLEANNSKEWMDSNKKEYEQSRSFFFEIVDETIAKYGKTDATIAHLEAKKISFRINRDIRFSANKAPYKNNFGATINRDGKKSTYAGYYIHFQNNGTFVGAGVYMPPADVLNKIRQEIDYNTTGFQKILKAKSFNEIYSGLDNSDKLKTAPKGYDKEADNIEFLKYKSYFVARNFKNSEVMSKDFISEILKTFKAAKPLVDFINEPLLN